MPPKRRRTVAAISTALDSLRAKIHSFADTADEEQLREVAQLIERLSISNNGPFRLLDLPYELLEYTAERYFTRGEAAPILSVNQVFNELFANRVWKRVKFNNMKVDGCKVPPVILMKNVRRIRSVNLMFIKPDLFVSGYFHYATSIAFDLKEGTEMFILHLEQMKCLRQVALILNDKSNSAVYAAAKWINDSRRSGHVQQIVICAASSSDSQQAIHVLTFLMGMIKSKKRIRLECGSLQLFPASVIQFMPATLTSLSVAEAIPTNCHGGINKQVFGTDPESVFLHLQMLHVQVCCNDSSLYSFQSFVPERFPVLKSLTMSIPEQSCNGDANTPLVTIFSSKQWPSIADLALFGNDTMVSGIGQLLFKAMPALRSCTFKYVADIDISPDLGTSLTISELTLIGTSLDTNHLLNKLTCLVYLELNGMDIDSSYLKFIASCKRLAEIKLTDCDPTKDAIVSVYNYPCNSVHKVIVSVGRCEYFTGDLVHLLPAFPNIRVLDLTGLDVEETRMSFMFKCPTVKILT
ncbi:hypothetical protein GQ42DRAFT_163690 [Ramicandelaber brevisporus]|nr:hypothetical protein GQ42DRAFT_163690 [Ramicandelaber brevisporus]